MKTGETLLVRGGTISVGMAAAAIARNIGVRVLSTTRNPAREDLLRRAGAAEVIIDDGAIAPKLRQAHGDGVDKVLELIGTSTLADSLRCARRGGLVCMTEMVGNAWSIADFSPMDTIPTAVGLTTYDGGIDDFMAMSFADLAAQVAAGTLPVTVGRVFRLDDIVEAHRTMEENRAGGKIIVLP